MVTARDGETSGNVPSLRDGLVVDSRYRVESLLGRGASGSVYAATELRRDGTEAEPRGGTALKVLRPELASDAPLRARFRREARLLAAVKHRGVVSIRRDGELTLGDASLPYLALDRLVGDTLARRLAHGPLDATELMSWLPGVAEALDAIHEHDVLHGDLKPENIFLRPEGPCLVDFGSAKVFGLPRLTATGELAGTPRYMAPEIILGSRTIDRRSDVYALGVLVYESLAARSPFDVRHPGRLAHAIATGAWTPLGDVAAAVPERIGAAVSQAMARAPERRFFSATAFVAALRG